MLGGVKKIVICENFHGWFSEIFDTKVSQYVICYMTVLFKGLVSLQKFLTGLSAPKFDSLRHDTVVRFDSSPLHCAAKRFRYQLHNAAG